tara:strand:+ start:182 stop:400 length:219 start_codon:yes stop_codon:yes gene_type:complete
MIYTTYNFLIKVPCGACNSLGKVSDRHPNDPSARLHSCFECSGSGTQEYQELYDCKEDALEDYPNALDVVAV